MVPLFCTCPKKPHTSSLTPNPSPRGEGSDYSQCSQNPQCSQNSHYPHLPKRPIPQTTKQLTP